MPRKRQQLEEVPVEQITDNQRRAIDDDPPVRARSRPPRPPARQAVRDSDRDLEREPSRRGATIVTGRDGEVLKRRHATSGDIFYVPPAEIPDGWDYQWNTVSVSGNGDVAREYQLEMHANGWRPVPASRHPGRWTAPDEKGAIIVKGLRLEERPVSLSDEAKQEDIARARAQMRDQTDALRLTEKLPKHFEASRKYRGTGGDVRMTIDKGLDIPLPQHELEE